MMKIYRNIWLLAALVITAFVACKDDGTEISTITSFEKFPTEFPAAITVAEPEGAEETHTITLTFNEAQVMNLHLEVSADESSTATEGVDFDFVSHEIEVLALQRKATVEIVVYGDGEPEGDETIVLHVASTDPYGTPAPASGLVITITNREYPTEVVASWEGEYTDSAGVQSLCDNIDIDLFLLDDQGNFAGGFGGATASCPETMAPGSLPDGTYSIVLNLYGNGALGSAGLVESPIHIEVILAKPGVLLADNSTIRYNTKDFPQVPLWTTFTPSDPDGLANVTVGTVRVSGGKVTLVNPAGTDVGQL
ncbi:MAG TPA: hypothetical protein VFV79_01035 [Saprospiraceae bacterium]|nr:hypothetical protein [Saprospiraceae bacterium]